MKIELINFLSQIVDYGIIGFLLILIYRIFKGTNIVKILSFFLILFILKKTSVQFNLNFTAKALTFILDNSLVLLVIIFQDEIKKFIFQVSQLLSNFKNKSNRDEMTASEIIAKACNKLSEKKLGALIVFEKEDSLENLISKGIFLDSSISKELLISIFEKKSPLHDGAVIIKNNRIHSASNFFPIKTDDNLDIKFGTRHRSALGISELADCLVIVVSEETGEIRIAENGFFSAVLVPNELKIILDQKLLIQNNENSSDLAYRFSSWIKRILNKNN